jgi:hypothetical protein
MFLTLALVEVEWSATRPCRFTFWGRSPLYPLDRFCGPRIGLNDVEKRKFLTLLGLELQPLCHPARSQSLYRLRYLYRKIYLNNILKIGYLIENTLQKKVKLPPVIDRKGPYGCEKSRLPCFLDNRLTDGGEVVSLTCRPPFTLQEDSWYSFLLEAVSITGP